MEKSFGMVWLKEGRFKVLFLFFFLYVWQEIIVFISDFFLFSEISCFFITTNKEFATPLFLSLSNISVQKFLSYKNTSILSLLYSSCLHCSSCLIISSALCFVFQVRGILLWACLDFLSSSFISYAIRFSVLYCSYR